jgi:hypothetical protein
MYGRGPLLTLFCSFKSNSTNRWLFYLQLHLGLEHKAREFTRSIGPNPEERLPLLDSASCLDHTDRVETDLEDAGRRGVIIASGVYMTVYPRHLRIAWRP